MVGLRGGRRGGSRRRRRRDHSSPDFLFRARSGLLLTHSLTHSLMLRLTRMNEGSYDVGSVGFEGEEEEEGTKSVRKSGEKTPSIRLAP